MKTKITIDIYTWSSRKQSNGLRKCLKFEEKTFESKTGLIQISCSNEKGESHITLYAKTQFTDGDWFKFVTLKNNQTFESYMEVVDD